MSLLHRLSAKLDAALHRFEKLDLGYTYDEMYPTPCGSSGSDKKTQYPSLYVNRTKVARGLIHASRADVLVELEAKLDGALQEFGLGTTGALIGGAKAAMTKKEGESTPDYLARTAKGAVKGAVIGTGIKVAGGLAGGALMAYAKRNPKMRNAMMKGERYRSKFGSMPRAVRAV